MMIRFCEPNPMPNARRGLALLATLLSLGLLGGCKDKNAASGGGDTGTTSTQNTASTSPSGGEEIVIGEYGSFTGKEAAFGASTHAGVQMAVDEANAAGGGEFAGKKVKFRLVKQDDQSEQSKVANAINLLLNEKPSVIIGEVASGLSKAGGTICQDKGVPMISPSSTQKSVTEIGDYIFRVCFIDPYQAAIVARFAIDGVKAKNVAIFTNKDTDYSKGFSNDFTTAFQKYGGKVVVQRFYGKNDSDYKGGLSALKAFNPDAILVPGYYNDSGSICKQARELGITVPILGGDGWDNQELLKAGGAGLVNCFYSTHMDINDPSPTVKQFVDAYKAKYTGTQPDALGALGYDSARLAIDAMKRAKGATNKDLRDALAETKNFAGVSGTITIDPNRNAFKTAVMMTVKNNQMVLDRKIDDPDKPLVASAK